MHDFLLLEVHLQQLLVTQAVSLDSWSHVVMPPASQEADDLICCLHVMPCWTIKQTYKFKHQALYSQTVVQQFL